MFKYIRNLALVVVVIGILFGAISAVGTPVQAQQNSSSLTEVAQATDIDQTDPDAPADPDADPTADPDAVAEDPDAVPTPEPTCESSISAVGWIICPVIRITYGFFSWLVDVVLEDGLLRINILDDGEEQLRAAWGGFRTLANLIFVIAFFVIIYAEATGRVGILETYSVTRLLPKAALSVIGIQLSFFICAYLISLFNDLGEGVTQLVLAPVEGFSQFELTFTNFGDGTFFGLPVANLGEGFVDSFIGIAAIAVVGWIAYIVLESVLVFALVGLALLFFTLILRKVLIVALVVVSPIAFAAWVLPGTDRVFRMWWDSFIKALAMYPLIMLFIASGQLVGRLAVVGDASFIDSIVSIIATFAPLFLIPATFRFAGTAVAAVGNTLKNAAENQKGDVRDPNSMRGSLRRKRGQRYGRLFDGQVRTPGSAGFQAPKALGGRQYRMRIPLVGDRSVMPGSIARAWNRLPNTDSSAGLATDILQGREAIDTAAKTLGDDVPRAAAVTGGGKNRGVVVQTADGTRQWAGYRKLGTHFVRDEATGGIFTQNGIAQVEDDFGMARDATSGDFYSPDVMAWVHKYDNNRGFMMGSFEHAMSKTSNNDYRDRQQVIEGMDATTWRKAEKVGMYNGVWNKIKDQGIDQKFFDKGSYFSDESVQSVDPGTGVMRDDTMPVNFVGMVDFIDAEMQAYPLQNQKAPTWVTLKKGVEDYATKVGGDGLTARQRDLTSTDGGSNTHVKLRSLAYKARNLIDQERQFSRGGTQTIPEGSDGETIGLSSQAYGSSATGSAAREAREFLRNYERWIGDIPGGSLEGQNQGGQNEPGFHALGDAPGERGGA